MRCAPHELCEGLSYTNDMATDDEVSLTAEEVADLVIELEPYHFVTDGVLDLGLETLVQEVVADAHAQVSGRPNISGGDRGEGPVQHVFIQRPEELLGGAGVKWDGTLAEVDGEFELDTELPNA